MMATVHVPTKIFNGSIFKIYVNILQTLRNIKYFFHCLTFYFKKNISGLDFLYTFLMAFDYSSWIFNAKGCAGLFITITYITYSSHFFEDHQII